jgi:hypothetical protein
MRVFGLIAIELTRLSTLSPCHYIVTILPEMCSTKIVWLVGKIAAVVTAARCDHIASSPACSSALGSLLNLPDESLSR